MFDHNAGRVLSACPYEAELSSRSSLLQGQGYQVVSCTDLYQAQVVAASEPFNVAIVGHGFPLREIVYFVQSLRGAGLPVIVLHDAPPQSIHADACLPVMHQVEQLIRVVGWLAWPNGSYVPRERAAARPGPRLVRKPQAG